ncbi:hypothetical protein GA0111570_10459 [Raineyella antarctica]|uniref:Uncharacterized protein n=1 Tax=Raineyella antarctica TaxID=1577474 RepID=A0A1G6GLM8_9ACTN|nr:hypothetical protein [Raineyella antarctica]SDB82877.1 hypothetical protein GA0111570_10459 [Raineyella antarctica]
MSRAPIPAGWTAAPPRAGRPASVLLDQADPGTARLVAHTEFATSTSMSEWRDHVVEGLGRSVADWLLVDVGPARVAGARGFRVLGASSPNGGTARIHETWGVVRDRHRCTVTLTCRVGAYDDIIDAVSAAVRDWHPPLDEGA